MGAEQTLPAGASSSAVTAGQENTASADNAQTLPLASLNGETVSLSQLRGKNVYIKFWATWCPLCLAGLEDFSILAEKFAASDSTAVISIVAPGLRGEVGKEDFIAWAKGRNIGFTVLFDETGAVNRDFGVIGYPTSVYLNGQGEIVMKKAGDETNEDILNMLSSLTES